ncbi:uncharacterized protein LOC115479647 [Microcaecilia unicolor]|uniref:Uncharacterized protein LOC115479647 n=1 Tax=Microcaecilia unicolor TaxID=1415580 RepID=A0A6P7ZDU9_9AMPH|nr:uncharacterized protein LOC115479647 [Microcaecilia unicolor]
MSVKMTLLTATVLALFVLLSSTLADIPQAAVLELSNVESSGEVHDSAHIVIRRAASHQVYDMYHGTSLQAAVSIIQNGFRPSTDGMLGPGVYVSRDIRKAQRYPLNLSPLDRIVLKVRVNVGRVIRIDRQGHPLQKTWRYYGYDTAWVPPNSGMVPSGLTENCVWDPKRVKVLDVVQASARSLFWLKSLLQQMKSRHCNYWLVC